MRKQNIRKSSHRSLIGVWKTRNFKLSESELSDALSGLCSIDRNVDFLLFGFVLLALYSIELFSLSFCSIFDRGVPTDPLPMAWWCSSPLQLSSLCRLFMSAPHLVSRCVPSIEMFDKNAIAANRRLWRALLNAFEFDIFLPNYIRLNLP